MKSNKFSLFIFILISPILVIAQELPQGGKDQQNNIEQNIENIIENTDNPDLDYTNLIDVLNNFKTNPINLNNTTPEELKELGLLSDIQINNLFVHLKKNGKLLVIYELQSIEGFSLDVIDKIIPYVYVNDNFKNLNISFKELFKRGKSTLDLRTQRIIENQTGYSPASDSLLLAKPNSRYLGNPYRNFARYRFNYGNKVQWGFTGEKDQGEEFFKGSQKQGFDFYSGYVYLKDIKNFKAIAVGDFRAQFGQGLVLWTDLAYAKTTDIIQFKRSAKGIRGYNSINENQFLRGVGITYQVFKNVEASIIASQKFRDANVPAGSDTLNLLSADEFTSFQLTGFHRTPGELQDRRSLKETVLGGNVSYKSRRFNVGLTAVTMNYNRNFLPSTQLYNIYNFSGNQNSNIGVDFNYVYKNVNCYGEAAQSSNGGRALVSGALITLDPKFFIHMVYRNYDKEYQAIYTRGFGESIGTQNEKGFITGFNFKPIQSVTISGYLDRFEFPYLKYRVDAPTQGYDWLVLADWSPTKKVQLNARYRKRVKPRNTPGTNELSIDEQFAVSQENIRFNFVYTLTPNVRLKNRLEFNSVFPGDVKAKAFLFYQDVNYKKQGSKWSGSLRYAIFDAPDFDARVFMLETDVPYSFSFPSLIGKGQRFYFLINYDVSKNFEIWVRYSQTYYQGATMLNAGTLNESFGPIRSEAKIHVRYKF